MKEIEDRRNLEKMKVNESGRQKLGIGRSRHSTQNYTLTNYRLRKREPMIALGSHHGEPLTSASALPGCRDNLEEACAVSEDDCEKAMTMKEKKKKVTMMEEKKNKDGDDD